MSGTNCGGCREIVDKLLKDFPGIISARVMIPARRAVIEFDPAVFDEAAMVKAVTDVGVDIDYWD